MKNILITGSNSFVGTMLEMRLAIDTNKYKIDTVDMKNDSWKDKDFSKYDVIVHVAGIAHIKETKENKDLYYKVNRDLAYETAKKAKSQGVKQFIFLSTISIYGLETGTITKNTPANPKSNYGKSKLQAEQLILPLEDESFKIAIVRPPMIYGKGCKGNYPKLAKLAVKTPIFPKINNRRSMIFIENLIRFIELLIDNCSNGLFFPQNREYINTSEMVKLISEFNGKTIMMIKIFNPIIRLFKNSTVNKLFGDLIFDESLSENKDDYCIYDFKESIKLTECVKNIK